MTGAWLLLALALLALGGRRVPRSAAPDPSAVEAVEAVGSGGAGGARGPAVAAVAAGAAGAASVASLGWPVGAWAAVPVAGLVLWTLRWLAARPASIAPDRGLALVLDLCAAALRAGFPLADALTAAAHAGGEPVRKALGRVAGLLRLGSSAAEAWAGLPAGSPLAPVVPVAIRSASSGLRLADAFERLAVELRAELAATAAARAHRAGVWAIAPLGTCFLPSFVCLGIVPVIVGIARSATGVLP